MTHPAANFFFPVLTQLFNMSVIFDFPYPFIEINVFPIYRFISHFCNNFPFLLIHLLLSNNFFSYPVISHFCNKYLSYSFISFSTFVINISHIISYFCFCP